MKNELGVQDFKGTNISKAFESKELTENQKFDLMKAKVNETFEKGLIDELTHTKALEQLDNLIQKGKSFPIGTIHNGFKKTGEGVWKKVSERRMTKQEHEKEAKFHEDRSKNIEAPTYKKDAEYHKLANETEASKLDDKDYSDADVHSDEGKRKGLHHISEDTKEIKEDLDKKKEGSKKLTIPDLESKVPGYLNMKEYKTFKDAKSHLDSWEKEKITQFNKRGYDQAQNDSAEAAKKYRSALENKLK